MKFGALLLCILAFVVPLTQSLKSSSKSAVVPCTRRNSIFDFGHGLLKKAFREAKVPFCSDLERITLQLTRPTSDPVTEMQIKQLVGLLNTDYDDPQLMIGFLVKLSRKYSETNALTKTKALFVLHRMMKLVHVKAQAALAKSFASLQLELDEKKGVHFFCRDSASQCGTRMEDAAALEAVELCRQYSQYVFDFLVLKGESNSSKTKKKSASEFSNEIDRAEAVMSLLALGEVVEAACKRVSHSVLGKQCSDSVKDDRVWALAELKRLYENGAITDTDTKSAVSSLLIRLKDNRVSKKSPLDTSGSNKISLPSSQSSGGVVLKKSDGTGTMQKRSPAKSVGSAVKKPTVEKISKSGKSKSRK